jgi:uncharacterized protein YecE (DUF72 family)
VRSRRRARAGDRGSPGLTGPPGSVGAGARGRLLAGTSGFAYPAWSPRFYPAGLRGDALLQHYAAHLPSVELNNTFYRQPSPAAVARWLAATPPDFRFSVKAQRSGSLGAMAADPAARLEWLTTPLRAFSERLGTVLFRVPERIPSDLDRLKAMLDAWPRDLPLTIEFQDPSWQLDEVHELLAGANAALCATDLPDHDEPAILATGSWVYVRLRRPDYDAGEIRRWADRLAPFLETGLDVFAFFRHDEVGRGAELALELQEALSPAAFLPARRTRGPSDPS